MAKAEHVRLVSDSCNKTKECGNCKFFSTNGWIAPSGKCSLHPDFDVCMDYDCFPLYATVCDDFEKR